MTVHDCGRVNQIFGDELLFADIQGHWGAPLPRATGIRLASVRLGTGSGPHSGALRAAGLARSLPREKLRTHDTR